LEGQLNDAERQQIEQAITTFFKKNPICLEVGTYKGGGSTLQILRTLAKRGGHLFGIEASPEIYEEMKAGLFAKEPELFRHFTPLCGFSQKVIPDLFSSGKLTRIDFAFLDGGNNPREQIDEFRLLDPRMPIGSIIMAHDALLRKGKWLRRILPVMDHYETRLIPTSVEGLLVAKKIRSSPSRPASLKAAAILFFSSLSPLELAAQLSPASLRSMVFRTLPRKWASWIADGRSL
jgi:predicted O-methyltransferase YrrM